MAAAARGGLLTAPLARSTPRNHLFFSATPSLFLRPPRSLNSRQRPGLVVTRATAAPPRPRGGPTAAAAAAAAESSGGDAAAAARLAVAPQQQQQAAGSLFGAVALITGSTVGAGMLALPAVSAPAGTLPTAAGLVGIHVLLTASALLIAEVNIAAREARDARDPAASGVVTLRQMAEYTLGRAGQGLTLAYLMLAYALLTAYCSKAAEVLDYLAGGGLPPLAPAAAFCAGVGALLYLGSTRSVDALNQGLTVLLLSLFAVIVSAGAVQADLPTTLLAGPSAWGALGPCLPIMLLALVWHDLLPVIVDRLGGCRATIRTAIVFGSLVPLTATLGWEAVALSLLPPLGLADGGAGSGAVLEASLHLAAGGAAPHDAPVLVSALADGAGALPLDPLEVFVRRSGPVVGRLVEAFSFLAVGTSFIGTALSLSETLRTEVPPLLQQASKQLRRGVGATVSTSSADADAADDEAACLRARASGGAGAGSPDACAAGWEGEGAARDHHGLALLLTLCPPLALAATNPDSFLGALELSGGYFMTGLYGLLPPLMAYQLRKKMAQQAQQHEELVPGGTGALAVVFSCAAAIFLSRVAADVGLAGGGSPLETMLALLGPPL